jgi:hypothetical protein
MISDQKLYTYNLKTWLLAIARYRRAEVNNHYGASPVRFSRSAAIRSRVTI